VRIKARRKRAFVVVEIVDTGPGFGAEGRRKLFEQFFTTKPGGLGLGMSISRALIESNGGTIQAPDSSSGASIRFTLPVARARRSRGGNETKGRPSAA
jgi:C4-dicarboxylate-specific signal transduction histidine kinase